MKRLSLFIIIPFFISCQNSDDYRIINDKEYNLLTVQDTLIINSTLLVTKVGDSIDDAYGELLVRSNSTNTHYLFNYECELENDSIIIAYSHAFLIDENGGFRKNGQWFYAKFHTEGNFPFHKNITEYSVDSIPDIKIKNLPKNEGIYYFENNSLKLITDKQSESEFQNMKKNGFYYIPNKGRLFNRININKLE